MLYCCWLKNSLSDRFGGRSQQLVDTLDIQIICEQTIASIKVSGA